jgi:hypothetical protein
VQHGCELPAADIKGAEAALEVFDLSGGWLRRVLESNSNSRQEQHQQKTEPKAGGA